MLVITDEDVPDDVGQFLGTRGHEIILVREAFMPGTDDSVIAKAASEQRAVVFTWNKRHFFALAHRKNAKGEPSYPGMSVVGFGCSHVDGLSRISATIDDG